MIYVRKLQIMDRIDCARRACDLNAQTAIWMNSGSIEGQSTLHIWAKRRSFQIIYEQLP